MTGEDALKVVLDRLIQTDRKYQEDDAVFERRKLELDAALEELRGLRRDVPRLRQIAADHAKAEGPLRELYEAARSAHRVFHQSADAPRAHRLELQRAINRLHKAATDATAHIDLIPF